MQSRREAHSKTSRPAMGLRAPMDPAELLSSLQAGRVGQSDKTNLQWSYQETEVKTPRDLNSIWFEVQGKRGPPFDMAPRHGLAKSIGALTEARACTTTECIGCP